MLPDRLEYDPKGAFIRAYYTDGRRHIFADIRGHGFLTGTGSCNLPAEQAYAIQDVWGRMICDLYNSSAQALKENNGKLPDVEPFKPDYICDPPYASAEALQEHLALCPATHPPEGKEHYE